MESDCTILTKKMRGLRTPKGVLRTLSFCGGVVIFLVAIVWRFPVTSSLFLDCNSINAAKKCECSPDSNGDRLECPFIKPPEDVEAYVYPITMKVQKDAKTGNAYLTVTCSVNSPDFQWNLIEGIDLSPDKLDTVVDKIIIEYCPMVDDGLAGLFERVNLTGEQLTKLSFLSTKRNISTIPPNFFSLMKNLEVVVLPRNQLNQIPDFTGLTKLRNLNLNSNNLVNIPSQSFVENKNLESIGLAGNKLEQIELDAIPQTVKTLDLSGNKNFIPSSKFLQRLTNLSTLHFKNINLGAIEDDAFDDLQQLKVLILTQGFGLQKTMSFKNLANLKELHMNYLMQTSPNTSINLQNLPSLEIFDARSSGLHSLPQITGVPKLSTINLDGNKIANLSVKFFEETKSLTNLDLSNNQIEELVQIKATSLNALDLHNNRIKTLTSLAFRHLGLLESLNLRNNSMEIVEFKAFESQGNLQRLDLSHNRIKFDPSPFYSSSGDVFGEINNHSPLHPCSNLNKLDLSHNNITEIYDDWRNSKTQLTELDLSFNSISNLTAYDLNFVARKLKLNLAHNNISSVNLQNYFIILHDNPSSINVYLDGNPLRCDCEAYTLKNFSLPSHDLHVDNLACASPKELEGKMLSTVPEKDLVCSLREDPSCPSPCHCLIRPVDTTLVADCSNKGFFTEDLKEQLSWNLSPLFSRWNAELNLSGNKITEHKLADYLSTLSNQTRRVNLRGNQIKSISFLEKLPFKVSLAHNPFVCDRDHCKDFVELWPLYFQQIEDSENVTCSRSSTSQLEVHLQDIAPLLDDCNPDGTHLLIIIVAVFSVLCVVLILVIFRYAWVIKAFLYSKGCGWCLFWDADYDPEDEEKLYDAFVSYSHKDEEWVIEELVNRLEDKEGFKLCLHFRDWTPGDWIPDQIVKSVDQSKRTVVILSKNFVESVWSRLEFKAAHAQALSQRSNRVILVLLEDDLKEKDVKDDDLRVYMKTNTYLKWNDPWFWHKLKYALPHRKSNEDQHDLLRKLEQRERAIQLDKLRAKLEQTV